MKNPLTVNHGEGDPEAAQRFNKEETEFVASKRGKKRIREGVSVQPGEQAELDESERRGKARARGDVADHQQGKSKLAGPAT